MRVINSCIGTTALPPVNTDFYLVVREELASHWRRGVILRIAVFDIAGYRSSGSGFLAKRIRDSLV
jgi:hypothetical protein